MVASFNELRKLGDEQFTETLSSVYKIVNTERNEDEPYDACTQERDVGDVKHTGWPIPILSMHRSNQAMIECDRCILYG
jgi:hypothetical protein